MNKMIKIIILMLFLLMGITITGKDSSIEYRNGSSSEMVEKEDEAMEDEKSIQLLIKNGNLDSDSAEGTMDTLADLGISSLNKVKKISSRDGVTLRVIDSRGDIYYLGYGEFGYLEIVRKDSKDGKLLYAPID